MKTTGNTILITGGSAGIGLEVAKLLSAQGNQVIIVGRDQARLAQAKSQWPQLITFQADISEEEDVKALYKEVAAQYPTLNLLINNAGKAFTYDLVGQGKDAFAYAASEMLTNYLAIIRLNEFFLPLLKSQPDAAIVNVSSVVAYVPSAALATYAASKAALHSYTISLRLSLLDTNVKVFELFPPLVNTEFSKEIGGENGIHPSVVAEELLTGLQANEFEIRVGDTAKIYELSLSSPLAAIHAMNGLGNEATANLH